MKEFIMIHKFEEYPELAEMMQEYAAFGRFRDWQRFTDALNNALDKAENLPIHDVVGRSEQCDHDYSDGTGTGWNVCKKCGDMY